MLRLNRLKELIGVIAKNGSVTNDNVLYIDESNGTRFVVGNEEIAIGRRSGRERIGSIGDREAKVVTRRGTVFQRVFQVQTRSVAVGGRN